MLLAAALAVMTSGRVFAQDTKVQTDLAGTKPVKTQATLSDASPANTAAVSTISLRAIKDFKGRFANVKDERWYTIDKGFLAYFSLDGYRERVYYDRAGHWQASLIYADEHRLPPFIRDIVRRAYYDMPITFVQVIEVPGHVAYMVQVQDKTNLKVLRVSEEGEIEIKQELVKE